MFSGKTTELQRQMRRFNINKNRKCVMIGYSKDDRYDTAETVLEPTVTTHDGIRMTAVVCTRLDEPHIAKAIEGCEMIGINEGQFFETVAEFADAQANLGKRVIVAALDGTYQRKPFDSIAKLIPLSDTVVKLSAVCRCDREAPFSKRFGDDDRLEVIGGKNLYAAVCRKCYFDDDYSDPETPLPATPHAKAESTPADRPVIRVDLKEEHKKTSGVTGLGLVQGITLDSISQYTTQNKASCVAGIWSIYVETILKSQHDCFPSVYYVRRNGCMSKEVLGPTHFKQATHGLVVPILEHLAKKIREESSGSPINGYFVIWKINQKVSILLEDTVLNLVYLVWDTPDYKAMKMGLATDLPLLGKDTKYFGIILKSR